MTHTALARGALAALPALLDEHVPSSRVALVIDDTVDRAHGARVRSALGRDALTIAVPSGEQHKTREQWARITDALLDAHADRDTVIVGMGGGVITDLAGFVAATFLRGVRFVSVPTTLLAMVDAAHGGKTGVDTPMGKNLVGAFHEAVLVVVDPDVLHTLPATVWRDGFAEVLKHGVIADAEYFTQVHALLPALLAPGGAAHAAVGDIVARSIAIKQTIVASDPRERGARRTLNFGHTIAHALERVTHYGLSHGEAVAIGMCVEARIAHALGLTADDTVRALDDAVHALGLATRPPDTIDPEALLGATRGDKKAMHGSVRYALPTRIGAMHAADGAWALPVSDDVVRAALRA